MEKHNNFSDPKTAAFEFVAEILTLPTKYTPKDARVMRRKYSRKLKQESPEFILELARELFRNVFH